MPVESKLIFFFYEGWPNARLICDGAAGAWCAQGGVGAAVVGADRVARNGDAANKIGTLQVR